MLPERARTRWALRATCALEGSIWEDALMPVPYRCAPVASCSMPVVRKRTLSIMSGPVSMAAWMGPVWTSRCRQMRAGQQRFRVGICSICGGRAWMRPRIVHAPVGLTPASHSVYGTTDIGGGGVVERQRGHRRRQV